MVGAVEEVPMKHEHALDDFRRSEAGRKRESGLGNHPGGFLGILVRAGFSSGREDFDTKVVQFIRLLFKQGELLETHVTGGMPEKKESGLAGAAASPRSAGCKILVTDLGKELASLEQDTVGSFRFGDTLFVLNGGFFRGLEKSFSRISD